MNTGCESDERGGARLLGFVFAFTFCVSAASAVTLSNSGGGSWAYYKEITVKEEW
ncbi:MAG: hypothetical protein N2V73_04945 [Candidatus Methanospirare jalkutatii]|nr:hypothetical protein [Candidatus Methanospirare jalkutatii]